MAKSINYFTKTLKPPKMKKIILLLQFSLITVVSLRAQSIDVGLDGKTLTVITTGSKYPVVTQTSNPVQPSGNDQTKRTKLWFEAGNGYFATTPVTNYTVIGIQGHEPLLMATNLYDTTKDQPVSPPGNIISKNMNLTSGTGTNSFTQILGTSGIKITPNAYDIVPGDPMAFAITYKIPDVTPGKGDVKKAPVEGYKIYFLYNNNRTFDPVSPSSNNQLTVGGKLFDACRPHNAETVSYNAVINKPGVNTNTSANWVCFSNISANEFAEKNVFVSLKPFTDLETGKSGSVYAVLTTANDEFVAADSIPNMHFGPAHDPNYLVMQPYCLRLPKKVNPFNFTVHFQNTGEGNANEVKVVVQLPRGFDLDNLNVKSASFAGIDYKTLVGISKDKSANQVIAIFKSTGVASELWGTATSLQPATDPKTMGEIQFTVNSTPNTDDVLTADADIYFRSVHPSSSLAPDGYYEKPVKTNTGVTKYKNSCECRDCPEPSCKKFLGLCWWWWILILLGAMLVLWLLLHKRKKEEVSSYN
jgi:hypothetical protein